MTLPTAEELHDLLCRLYPITRSITGDGVRHTLKIINEIAEFKIHEISSGTTVFDWTVPREWVIRDAFIADSHGNRIVDYHENGLHVLGYSTPINQYMSFEELESHLYSLPDAPDAIPYRTSYFRENWGFCLTEQTKKRMDRDAIYHVLIDSELKDGALTLADSILPGSSGQNFLISTYCCHPWMANDNLSGVVLTTYLQRWLASRPRVHGYRLVVLPETIGAITYLARNQTEMERMDGGFVVSCCGGPGRLAYKETYLGNHLIDRAVMIAFRDRGIKPWIRPFAPDGSDERQYSMPGFRIPVGTIAKDKYYDYAFYHTSKDDPDFVTGKALRESLDLYIDAIEILEKNHTYRSTMPYCEPQLGKRGLYPQTGGAMKQAAAGSCKSAVEAEVNALTWVMFLADGTYDLLTMAERSGEPFRNLAAAVEKLLANELLVKELADHGTKP